MADFVVTGTGRCGTAHFFRVLNALGVPTTHETFFGFERDRFDAADRAAYKAATHNDVSLMAAPFLADVGVPSIHLVREPVKCVNSFLHLRLPLSADHPLCHFIHRFTTLEGDSDEDQWADYWEKWNALCARSATLTLRVEALSNGEVSDDELAPILGVRGFVQKWRELGVTPNRMHPIDVLSMPPPVLERLERAGERYGYYRAA
jgi:hypothetical protein